VARKEAERQARSAGIDYATRFPGIKLRHHRNVTRVGVPGHRGPFTDSYWRFACKDDPDDALYYDRGPSFASKAEALAELAEYAEFHGYPVGG
jgi:hypothetical protein